MNPAEKIISGPIGDGRGSCNPETAGSTEPCRRSYSREEMIEEAKMYMRETYGQCRESEDQDRWHERLGMLVDFIHDRFPSNVTEHRQGARQGGSNE